MTDALNINYFFALTGEPEPASGELHILIKECLAQSRTAQKKLYDRYAPAAYGVIKRYLYDNEPAAKELLNDVFYKVFTRLPQYTFQGAFEGWIRKIVINAVTDYLRRNLKKEKNTLPLVNEDIDVEEDALSKLSYKDLLATIHTLPEVHLAVFNLFVFEQYTHKDIAAALKMTENSSRWYLNDARRRLKLLLNRYMK
ncbi:MAG: sigma-70 family RNA polymerase sigma factor [Chitinophagia bacterium]|nr:sigma-70 family RNA polymerase sigma factor [Chitinophagia bacterium]